MQGWRADPDIPRALLSRKASHGLPASRDSLWQGSGAEGWGGITTAAQSGRKVYTASPRERPPQARHQNPLLRLANFPDKDFLLWHNIPMERGRKRLEKLRKRRQKAVVLFEQGERQCSVAQHLRVSRQSVSEWWLAWHNGDTKALNGATRAGRKPRLDKEQLALVEKELLRGATAHGWETELWSLPRVAKLIKSVTGVSYHPGHVWKILRQMNWSLQRPTLRAKERDEEKIRHQWKTQTWEEQKKTPKSGVHG